MQTNASSSTIGITSPSTAAAGDLIVVGAYMTGQDARLVTDAPGDGWKILEAVHDSGGNFGALIAAIVAKKSGGQTWAGLTLPGNAAWSSCSITYSLTQSSSAGANQWGKFDVAAAHGCGGGVTAAGSSTTISSLRDGLSYHCGLVFTFVGATNDGAGGVETVTWASGFEQFDTGQNAPPHTISCNLLDSIVSSSATSWQDATTLLNNFQDRTQTATFSAACTNRAAVKGFIPITGNLNAGAFRQRYMSGRRGG